MTTPADIQAAIGFLEDGGVIALPTDTLYALAANARDAAAVRRVYNIKVRETGKPLPLFVSSLEMARDIGVFDAPAEALARRFWPGALTIVVAKHPFFESDALAGGDTVALRQPASDVITAVVQALGAPVTATSANRSGGPNPITAADVRAQIGDAIDMVLDAGPCPGARSSTIVDCTADRPRILRHGVVSEADIEAALGAATARE